MIEGAKFPLPLLEREWLVVIHVLGYADSENEVEEQQIKEVYLKLKELYEKTTGQKV
jgi:hypothetical protein